MHDLPSFECFIPARAGQLLRSCVLGRKEGGHVTEPEVRTIGAPRLRLTFAPSKGRTCDERDNEDDANPVHLCERRHGSFAQLPCCTRSFLRSSLSNERRKSSHTARAVGRTSHAQRVARPKPFSYASSRFWRTVVPAGMLTVAPRAYCSQRSTADQISNIRSARLAPELH